MTYVKIDLTSVSPQNSPEKWYALEHVYYMADSTVPEIYSEFANERVTESYFSAFKQYATDNWSLGVLMKKLQRRLDSLWIDKSVGKRAVSLLRRPWTGCLVRSIPSCAQFCFTENTNFRSYWRTPIHRG